MRLARLTRLLVLLAAGQPVSAQDASDLPELELTITAKPEIEVLDIEAHLRLRAAGGPTSFRFLKPTTLRVWDRRTGSDLRHGTTPVAPEQGVHALHVSLDRRTGEHLVGLRYRYDAETFSGSSINPATNDDAILGQVTKESIYASHLDYYPNAGSPLEGAVLRIVVPRGWVGVTGGELAMRKELPNGTTLYEYRVPYDSGRLPYPLAIYPYVVTETRYDDRLPVSIYSSAKDAGYAKEKLKVITEKILPFLEELMGPFPYPCVRVVEVFPKEGNTGLAAKGVVMLSQRIWFAAPIGKQLDSEPVGVLVDELAHQWNYYKVMLPNFLAEGVSEYTSALFLERHVGKDSLERRMAEFRQAYLGLAAFLDYLKRARASGLTAEQVAKQLDLPVEDVTPLWPYATHGELPITDARGLPSLYFIKGALAIHALRDRIGDEGFFEGFERLFAEPSKTELSLDDYRKCFESAHGASLKTFFRRWYYEVGLPK